MKLKQYNGDFQKLEERQERIGERIEGSKAKYRASLKGGIYRPPGRNTWRVWYPWKTWKGGKFHVNQYLDGTPLYVEEQAQRVLNKIRAEDDQGILDPTTYCGRNRALQIEKAWDMYMEHCPCGKIRMEARERTFQKHILPYFKNVFSMRNIEQHHIWGWWGTIPKTYEPGTLRVIRATLVAFLNFHPVTRIKAFKFPVVKVPKKTPEWYSKKEQGEILEFISSHDQRIFRFLMAYGCRVSEPCILDKIDDLDWVKNTITFRERKNDKENTLQIFDEVKFLLKDSGKVSHMRLVFCTEDGEPYNRHILYRAWKDAGKKAYEVRYKDHPVEKRNKAQLGLSAIGAG